MKNKKIILFITMISSGLSFAAADRLIKVDEKGIMRFADNGQETAFFGVNYCLPSASAFRMVARVKASYEETIANDISHFERMGLDGIRLSFWGDWECADANGNLIDNEHLRLLDYLIFKAKQHGIYMLFSPIILYDPRWPDDLQSPIGGFSKTYGKGRGTKIGTDPNGIKIQINYLRQIMGHVNRYTKTAYKDEPAIFGLELVNEPYLPPNVTEYINTLAKTVRGLPCEKAIFFNVSQNKSAVADVSRSNVEGLTYGWYPTELLAQRTLNCNFLLNVEDFPMMKHPLAATKAKAVYEFDTADIAGAYLYPAMAREFREGGCQFAAMFTYDPLPIAAMNIEFQTHYLNLIYTPNKAMSFVIASRAFHNLPMFKSYGAYPENCKFENFRISYEQNLSEFACEKIFMYSNDTKINPPDSAKLEEIAGCGSSPIVSYEGTGCYFLDKIENGIWRLEIYPDAVIVNDPYSKLRFGREVSRVLWHKWPIEINIPDLGSSFAVTGINENNNFSTIAEKGRFETLPGIYLLKRNDLKKSIPLVSKKFIAPADKKLPAAVIFESFAQVTAGKDFEVTAAVCDSNLPEKVSLFVLREPHKIYKEYPMIRKKNYIYQGNVPAEEMKAGLIKYCITVHKEGKARTFPEGIESMPWNWDFAPDKLWETTIVEANTPIVMYDVSRDRDKFLFSQYWHGPHYNYDFVSGQTSGKLALHLEAEDLKAEPYDVSAKYILDKQTYGRAGDFDKMRVLCVRTRAAKKDTIAFGITLMEKDGSAWLATIPVTEKWNEIKIPLANFKISKSAMLPRGWSGHSYWLSVPANRGGENNKLNIKNIEALVISIGDRFISNVEASHGIELESISLMP